MFCISPHYPGCCYLINASLAWEAWLFTSFAAILFLFSRMNGYCGFSDLQRCVLDVFEVRFVFVLILWDLECLWSPRNKILPLSTFKHKKIKTASNNSQLYIMMLITGPTPEVIRYTFLFLKFSVTVLYTSELHPQGVNLCLVYHEF